jgi:transposase
LLLGACPRGQILSWQDPAPHHTGDEVEEWLEQQSRIEVTAFPKSTPEENPQEGTWKGLKEEVSPHHWPETTGELRAAIDQYYQAGKKRVVNSLQKFGYRWGDGIIEPLPQTV